MSRRGWIRGSRANSFYQGDRRVYLHDQRATSQFEKPADFQSWSQSESPLARSPHPGYQINFNSSFNQNNVNRGLLPTPDRAFPRYDQADYCRNGAGGHGQHSVVAPSIKQRLYPVNHYAQAGPVQHEVGRPQKRYSDAVVMPPGPKISRVNATFGNGAKCTTSRSHVRCGRGAARGQSQSRPPRGKRANRGSCPQRSLVIDNHENGLFSKEQNGRETPSSAVAVKPNTALDRAVSPLDTAVPDRTSGPCSVDNNGDSPQGDEEQTEDKFGITATVTADDEKVEMLMKVELSLKSEVHCHVCVMLFEDIQTLMQHVQTSIHMMELKETEYRLKTELLRHQSLVIVVFYFQNVQ